MKVLISISRLALFRSLKIGLLQSIGFTILFSMMSFWTYDQSIEHELRRKIQGFLNNLESNINELKTSEIFKKIQSEGVAELILIEDKSCKIISSSTPLLEQDGCKVRSSTHYKKLDLHLQNKKVTLLYYFTKSKLAFFKTHGLLILKSFLLILVITVLTSYFFIKHSILRPIEKLKSEVIEGKESTFSEFNFLTTKLAALKREIEKREHQKSYYEAARIVLHDIRTPLHHLKISFENSGQKEAVQSKIDEIISLANESLTDFSLRPSSELDMLELFKVLKNEFQDKIEVKFREATSIVTTLPILKLKSILSNMINNAIEASASQVHLSSSVYENAYVLTISDNGSGFPKSLEKDIFIKEVTTKANGHGIGLFSASTILKEHDSKIKVNSHKVKGAEIEIHFNNPLKTKGPRELVLIDDDKFTRLNWEIKSKEAKISFTSYSSPDDFHKNIKKHSKDSWVFIDSILSGGLRGEERAREIYESGFQNITLCTNLDGIELSDYPWIKSISGKTYPIAFPTA